eukprot:scaffold4393_cov183-Ochromonas_danica.AAC.9
MVPDERKTTKHTMSSDLLAAHLAIVQEHIQSEDKSSAKTNKNKGKKGYKSSLTAKTPKGLPQPSVKVGKKHFLTSYVGQSNLFHPGAAADALKKSEDRISNIVETTSKRLKKRRKTRGDAVKVIKLQRQH